LGTYTCFEMPSQTCFTFVIRRFSSIPERVVQYCSNLGVLVLIRVSNFKRISLSAKTISHAFENKHKEKKASGALSIISHIDSSRSLTIFEAEGPLFFDEMVLAIKHFFEGKDNPPTNNILWDLRNATVDQFLYRNVEELAILASQIDKRKGLIKTAIVASNDSVFDFAKLYNSYIRKPRLKFEAFRSMDDADEWIKDKW
jgi:hypothetical protein